jgi:tRNA A37 threonylcarbamoyladenosine dehydratase
MTDREKELFERTGLLVGEEAMEKIHAANVIIFGIGGVGSWCAEGLVRSGVGNITIVDADVISASNVNRQLMATSANIGEVKTEALAKRLLEINPDLKIKAVHEVYSEENADSFDLDSYDYVIDAIDSLKDKALLILRASASSTRFFSSMGAALKTDPTRVRTGKFSEVKGCPLAAALRKKFKRTKVWPSRDFTCVFDDEVLQNKGKEPEEKCSYKAVTNGSLAPITGIFGLTLSGLVIKDITSTRPTS